MIDKKIILVVVRYYLPGYKSGGPVRSIANLVNQLGDEFDFRIITLDRDIQDISAYSSIVPNSWNQVGKAQVYYLSPENCSIRIFSKLLFGIPYDVLYLNSFFDPVFTLYPLLLRRLGRLPFKATVIAPRGEFSPEALMLKKWKKTPYIWLATVLGIYRNLTWHASSEHESMNILDVMKHSLKSCKVDVVIASDLPSRPNQEKQIYNFQSRQNSEPLRIIFLSRIVPMKNLDFALQVLKKVKILVDFHIYGPIEDRNYWGQCKSLIADIPTNISVKYCGSIQHSQVLTTLRSYDLFFLPTRGENYGHVIMESLSVGTPVLIADTTPWRNLEKSGVGWELPLADKQLFADKIEDVAKISNEAYVEWREKILLNAVTYASNPEVITSNRRLFVDVIN